MFHGDVSKADAVMEHLGTGVMTGIILTPFNSPVAAVVKYAFHVAWPAFGASLLHRGGQNRGLFIQGASEVICTMETRFSNSTMLFFLPFL